MNRNRSDNRLQRGRYGSDYDRQSEQLSRGKSYYGEDRSHEQMGEGGRDTYGQSDGGTYVEDYGTDYSRGGRDGERRGYTGRNDAQRSDDRPRFDPPRDYDGRGDNSAGYSSGSYGASQSGYREERDFRADEEGSRGYAGQRRDYGPARDRNTDYGASGERSYRRDERYDDRDHERGFFERAGDEVASWFGDDEATRRRRDIDHTGRGPSNYTRSDDRILEDACDRLTDDYRVDAQEIQVTVQDGEVTLDGKVGSRAEKRRAEDCVHDLSGVKHVQNNLRIRESGDVRGTTTGRSDSTTGTLA